MSRQTCPVCGSAQLREFLRRERVPVHQNLLCRTEEDARGIPRGTLAMNLCTGCGFIFNAEFDLSLLQYGEEYENTQTFSPAFLAYVDDLAGRIVDGHRIRNSTIVELGCGKGTFLTRLLEREPSNRGIGFDPSYVGPDEILGGRGVFRREFYGPETDVQQPDAVVCRHVIEHVPEPLEFLRSLRAALEDAPGAAVFFETPCVEWILRNRVVWDFFYEHCSLFTAESLAGLFERAGFRVTDVQHVFEGQYLWIEAWPAREPRVEEFDSKRLETLAAEFTAAETTLTGELRTRVEQLRERGAVALWGAGAKGATLANLIDADRQAIDCVVDLNPKKQGYFVPGTGHPIVDYRALPPRGVASAILMNENYREENEGLLGAAGIELDLVEGVS